MSSSIGPCGLVRCLNNGACTVVNGTAICNCPLGYTGAACGQDVDECASDPCQNNATCTHGIGFYECVCTPGFVGENCSLDDPCFNNPCKNGGTCVMAADFSYTCNCPAPYAYTGRDCDTQVDCFWDKMYAYGPNQQDMVLDVSNFPMCHRIEIKNGMWFYGRKHFRCFVCHNGLIQFDSKTARSRPTKFNSEDFPEDIALLAPFWAKIDTSAAAFEDVGSYNHSVVFYHLYESGGQPNETYVLGNASEEVQNRSQSGDFSRFKASWVLVVTWVRLHPTPFRNVISEKSNSFQAVLITNGTYTFLKYHYPCGSIEWSAPDSITNGFQPGSDAFPVAGYSAGDGGSDSYFILPWSGGFDIHRLEDEVGRNTNNNGEWFFRIEERDGDDSEAVCNLWLEWQEANLKPHVISADMNIISCPCTFFTAWLDIRYSLTFDNGGLCADPVRSVNFNTIAEDGSQITGTINRRCCYSTLFGSFGALINGGIDGGSMIVKYRILPNGVRDDDEAKTICCLEPNQCTKFYQVRPSDNCEDYTPPNRRWGWGDPHVVTADNRNYTFNGVGEYWVVYGDNGKFKFQARTAPAQGGLNSATVYTVGVVQEVNTSKVEVRVKSGGGLEVYIDGAMYDGYNNLTNVSKNIGGNLTVSRPSSSCLQIVFPSGSGIEFCEANLMLTFVVTLSEIYLGKTKGLQGTYNNNPDDEFTLPNGTILSPYMVSRDIHFDFGLQWQITDQESLFTYGPNENTSTFTNTSFIPMFVEEIQWADNDTRDAAVAACQGDVVCLFDAASTNDVSIGTSSKEVNIQLVEENEKLENFPPKFTYVPSVIEATLGEIVFINITASDNNSFTFTVQSQPLGSNFSADGNLLNFTWNVTSTEKVQVTFVVTDELDASTSFTPTIELCACGQNGSCVEPEFGDPLNSDAQFIYQGCSCSPGYTGRFCESDIDACESTGQPCFKGVTCTDLPAPAGVNGFQCGACPSGFTGDGVICDDVNECQNVTMHNCEQTCVNIPGSFVCECDSGYLLNEDGYQCDDINECEPTNDCMHQCNNTLGSYICYCNEFFIVDPNNPRLCVAANDCSMNDCEHVCYKKPDNTQACDCFAGYQLENDGKSCEDINECEIPGIKCQQRCVNKIGDYECTCYDGFKLREDGFTCSDINECLNSSLFSCPGVSRVCVNTQGSYKCECQDGLIFRDNICQELLRGEEPPEPTVPPPKSASELERQNSVRLQVADMTEAQYNYTVDKMFKDTIAQSVDETCSVNRTSCGITSKRRRRALGLFTRIDVHLIPNYPLEEQGNLTIAFYVIPPSVLTTDTDVIPVAVLVEATSSVKSDLESIFGNQLSGVQRFFQEPPTNQSTTVATTANTTVATTTKPTPDNTKAEDDDLKWIFVGVFVGLAVVIIIVIITYVCVRKHNQRKVWDLSQAGGSAEGNGNDSHTLVVLHGERTNKNSPQSPEVAF